MEPLAEYSRYSLQIQSQTFPKGSEPTPPIEGVVCNIMIVDKHKTKGSNMLQYIFYKTLRIFHIISKQEFKKRTASYDEKRKIALISKSPLFDKQWYIAQNPDVATKKINPAKHYYKHGWKEGRNPSPYFDGNKYLNQYPDVADADRNPLVHYLLDGEREGREYQPSIKGAVTPTPAKTSLWNKIKYIMVYPIIVKNEYDQLKAEIKALEQK